MPPSVRDSLGPRTRKNATPAKRKPAGTIREKGPSKRKPPAVIIKSTPRERGDDTRSDESFLRTNKDPKDFKADVDPSSLTNKVPENDPAPGRLDHPAAQAVQDDGTIVEAKRTQAVVDDVSAVTDHTKAAGATLPQSFASKVPGIGLPGEIPLIDARQVGEKEKKIEGKSERELLFPGNGDAPPNSVAGAPNAKRNEASDTLRPLFGIASPLDLVPSTRDQIKSGILFSDFHIVAPGYGLGVTNKLHLMNELREQKIRYHAPLAFPRSDQGPTNTVLPPPPEFQNEMTKRDVSKKTQEKTLGTVLAAYTISLAGTGSLNTLGDDYGLMRTSGAKGLPRAADSPLEPIVLKPSPMERVRPLSGEQLEDRDYRRLFDSQRYPERFHPLVAQSGGPIMNRRSALRMLPFPLGMA